MSSLLIENYNIIINSDSNEYWNLYTIDSNFMLSKYSGKGSDTVKMIKYSDVDDYQGSVKLIINGNKCILPSDVNESDINVANDSIFFVTPTFYEFMSFGDIFVFNVKCNKEWDYYPKTSENFSIRKVVNGLEVKSLSNDKFNENIKIFSNSLNVEQYVNVKQDYLPQVSTSILTVNPKNIKLYGDNKEFELNVLSLCDNQISNDYTFSTSPNFNLVKKDNIVKCTIISINNFKDTITFRNINCKDDIEPFIVNVQYNKDIIDEHYLLIKKINGEPVDNIVGGVYDIEFDENVENNRFIIEIESSSDCFIESYNDEIVNCSINKIDDKKYILIIDLINFSSKFEETIKVVNNDGDYKYINYTISENIIIDTDTIFCICDGDFNPTSKEYSVNVNYNENYNYKIFSFNNEGCSEWFVNNSNFELYENGNLTKNICGGLEDNGLKFLINKNKDAAPIVFKPTQEALDSLLNDYTITLLNKDAANDLVIKVNLNKQVVITHGYDIDILYNWGNILSIPLSKASNLIFTVTPYYFYNGTKYGMKDNKFNQSKKDYLGVDTNIDTNNLELINADNKFDYKLKNIPTTPGEYKITVSTIKIYHPEINAENFYKHKDLILNFVKDEEIEGNYLFFLINETDKKVTFFLKGGEYKVNVKSEKNFSFIGFELQEGIEWVNATIEGSYVLIKCDEYVKKDGDKPIREGKITLIQNESGNMIEILISQSSPTLVLDEYEEKLPAKQIETELFKLKGGNILISEEEIIKVNRKDITWIIGEQDKNCLYVVESNGEPNYLKVCENTEKVEKTFTLSGKTTNDGIEYIDEVKIIQNPKEKKQYYYNIKCNKSSPIEIGTGQSIVIDVWMEKSESISGPALETYYPFKAECPGNYIHVSGLDGISPSCSIDADYNAREGTALVWFYFNTDDGENSNYVEFRIIETRK